ncbi:contractile injection system tape measure protein [Endozoicomonadaceae bacterium StTr2]
MSESRASSEVEKLKLDFVFSYEQPETALTTRLEQAVYRTLEAYQPPAVSHPVSIERINIELDELQLTGSNTSDLLQLEQQLEQLLVTRLDQCFEQLQQTVATESISDSSRQDLQPIASQHEQASDQSKPEHDINVATPSDATQFQLADLLQREYSTTELLQQLEQPEEGAGIEIMPGAFGSKSGSGEVSKDIANSSFGSDIARPLVTDKIPWNIEPDALPRLDTRASAKSLITSVEQLLQSLEVLSEQTGQNKKKVKKSRILLATLHQTLQEVRALYPILDKYTVSPKNASPDVFHQAVVIPKTLKHQLQQFEELMQQCIPEKANRIVEDKEISEPLQHEVIRESHTDQQQSLEQPSQALTDNIARAQQSGREPAPTPNDSDYAATVFNKKNPAPHFEQFALPPSSQEEKQARNLVTASHRPDLINPELPAAQIQSELLQLLSLPELPLKLVRMIDQWCRQAQDIPDASRQRWLQRIIIAIESSPAGVAAKDESSEVAPKEVVSAGYPGQHIKGRNHISADGTEDISGHPEANRSATASILLADPELQRKQQQWQAELQQLPLQVIADTRHSVIHSWQQALPGIKDRILLARGIHSIEVMLQQASLETPELKQLFYSRRQRWLQWLHQLDPAKLYLQQLSVSALEQNIQQIKTLISVQRRLLRSGNCPQSALDDNRRRLAAARQVLAQQLTFGSQQETLRSAVQTVIDSSEPCHSGEEKVIEVQQPQDISKTTTRNKAFSTPTSRPSAIPDPGTLTNLSQAVSRISRSLQQTLQQLKQAFNAEQIGTGPKARYAMPELSANERIEVQNAGLVLLWPHLSRLFTQCELLAADQSFIDTCHQHQAMALLEYIAGADACPEVQQQNRITTALITGLKPEEIPDTLPTLPDSRSQHADQLLAAVISQWSALRDITPQGLRSLFLQRNGQWEPYDNGWKLIVEDKAQDILLQALPWPVSMITLPWLGGLLSVHWKTPAIQLK